MSSARFAVTPDPLVVDRVAADLEREAQRVGEGCGALNAFVGVVRARYETDLGFRVAGKYHVRVKG